jgi:hypothetical protein
VCNTEKMKIVKLYSMAASCYFGKNTRWCTTSRDKNDNMFNAYNDDGDIFVILDKANNRRWQFFFCTTITPDEWSYQNEEEDAHDELEFRKECVDACQFMDEKDSPVPPLKVMDGQAWQAIYRFSAGRDFNRTMDDWVTINELGRSLK